MPSELPSELEREQQPHRSRGLSRQLVLTILAVLLFAWSPVQAAEPVLAIPDDAEVTAYDVIAGALDLTRGKSSYAKLSMLVHRPSWQRTSTLVAWTRGREDAVADLREALH